jgi:hypothetical protein
VTVHAFWARFARSLNLFILVETVGANLHHKGTRWTHETVLALDLCTGRRIANVTSRASDWLVVGVGISQTGSVWWARLALARIGGAKRWLVVTSTTSGHLSSRLLTVVTLLARPARGIVWSGVGSTGRAEVTGIAVVSQTTKTVLTSWAGGQSLLRGSLHAVVAQVTIGAKDWVRVGWKTWAVEAQWACIGSVITYCLQRTEVSSWATQTLGLLRSILVVTWIARRWGLQ